MSNVIPFKKPIKRNPIKQTLVDGHFDDVLAKYRKPIPVAGIGIILGIAVLGTGLPWAMAQLMKGLINGY